MDFEPIGIDGEGVDGRYILLASSQGNYISNEDNGLTTEQCFQWLMRIPEQRLIWGFGFTYDVNMMLVSLAKEHLTRLALYGKVYWGDWRIKHIPSKQLVITDRTTGKSRCVWDMYPWVQSSFVKMLDEWGVGAESVIERIALMKDQRNNFADVPFQQIIGYCLEECTLLSTAVSKLIQAVGDLGYRPSGWYSPGSLAAVAMSQWGVKRYRKDPPTDLIRKAVEKAYYGGRTEVSRIGPIDEAIYESDIRSAYPYQAWKLPCFAHGKWIAARNGTIHPYSLLKVRWQCDRDVTWGPYPVRPAHGSLRYPSSGNTWAWGVEVLAGMALCNQFDVISGYEWVPECDHQPFANIIDVYNKRRELKEAGDFLEYVYKLILNSIYGKLAQHIESGPIPAHRFLPWAGLITAGTRAMLLQHIVAHREGILLCATDGILSTVPLSVTEGKALGEWEIGSYDKAFIAGPGFYTCFGEVPKVRSRGISRQHVDIDDLIAAWNSDGRDGKCVIETRRFMGYRVALQRKEDIWRKFLDIPMVKQLTVEPRRRWLTDDPFDGRSIAPTFADHKRLAKRDLLDTNQLAFQLFAQSTGQLAMTDEQVIAMAYQLDPYQFDPAEQPDWIIDEVS